MRHVKTVTTWQLLHFDKDVVLGGVCWGWCKLSTLPYSSEMHEETQQEAHALTGWYACRRVLAFNKRLLPDDCMRKREIHQLVCTANDVCHLQPVETQQETQAMHVMFVVAPRMSPCLNRHANSATLAENPAQGLAEACRTVTSV